MSEEPGKYETGRPPPEITPARRLELLEQAKMIVTSKLLRHQRKAPKSKNPRDKDFHEYEIHKCQRWLIDAARWMDALEARH